MTDVYATIAEVDQATEERLADIFFEVGDGRALRFPDGDFDAVVVHTTLCHVPQPERVLTEAARVLRPGGTLAVCDGPPAAEAAARRRVRGPRFLQPRVPAGRPA